MRAPSGQGARIVATARGWIGTPYVHQASCKGAGADCLGLVRGVWRDVIGREPVEVPPYTPDWAEARGEEALLNGAAALLRRVGADAARPGDLLVFRMRRSAVAKHLGILAETGAAPSFIHAYSGHAVLESPLTPPWARRIVAYFRFPERG
ncbi:NlpC/P60 family protein [Maritimibacter sp. HL-12]|jgi:NlpC/P60 family putative phage cell wall peptidase|uniref:NlpC/P60 family protein n=1 Tax=Maritimibacter sp. HL-12 TaxID=1162418 RepID=UPI000A0F1E2E|nr:NlpC/P60 family protein [Maritimibacter sp. HL-12]SMH55167.1 putative phage cell wall peptidase, NlpC/P60 family [Maritimibacter sp. HL-12]